MFRSKLTDEALAVPGLTSLKIRHLMNNLGAISNDFLEIGSHKGGTFCSTVFGNDHLGTTVAVDNFSEFNKEEGHPMSHLLSNVGRFKPGKIKFTLVNKNCWERPLMSIDGNCFDLYLYDGPHNLEDQRRACTQFLDSMANQFIFCVDDYSVWPFVKEGTQLGIRDSGCKVLFEQELYNGIEGDNFGWHMGFYVALLEKS